MVFDVGVVDNSGLVVNATLAYMVVVNRASVKEVAALLDWSIGGDRSIG